MTHPSMAAAERLDIGRIARCYGSSGRLIQIPKYFSDAGGACGRLNMALLYAQFVWSTRFEGVSGLNHF